MSTEQMTSKELLTQLEQAGWSIATSTDTTTGVSWYAYRRLIGGNNCICNDKPPSLCIQPYDLRFGEHTMRSVQFEVRGEVPSGKWVDFKVYGIKYEEVLAEVENCKAILLTAWNAVSDSQEHPSHLPERARND